MGCAGCGAKYPGARVVRRSVPVPVKVVNTSVPAKTPVPVVAPRKSISPEKAISGIANLINSIAK